ncbi:MAG: hypothetical protein HON65_04720 [Rhodospirillales bacterium]|jgi:hypothetical protein|nr:hypothetical protein [Rhodospirillales bacterium]
MTTDMDTLSEIKGLIEKVAIMKDNLADNERELFDQLQQKYAEPCEIGFDDKVLLEVMLRNITVRKDLGML